MSQNFQKGYFGLRNMVSRGRLKYTIIQSVTFIYSHHISKHRMSISYCLNAHGGHFQPSYKQKLNNGSCEVPMAPLITLLCTSIPTPKSTTFHVNLNISHENSHAFQVIFNKRIFLFEQKVFLGLFYSRILAPGMVK